MTNTVGFLLFSLISIAVCFDNNVPIYMWNVDTSVFLNIHREILEFSIEFLVFSSDAVVNPLNSIDSTQLFKKLAPAFDNKPLVIFLQDEVNLNFYKICSNLITWQFPLQLSVEDFKSGDLAAVKLIAEELNTFYAPAVTKTSKLPLAMETAGYRAIHVKSGQELPISKLKEKIVMIVELPATRLGDSRSQTLELNGNISIIYRLVGLVHSFRSVFGFSIDFTHLFTW